MPQTETIKFLDKNSINVKSVMALYQKVHVMRNTIYVEFHAFMKKCTIWLILGATPLYYLDSIGIS